MSLSKKVSPRRSLAVEIHRQTVSSPTGSLVSSMGLSMIRVISLLLLVLVLFMNEHQQVVAVSKRFLKGFIMGHIFARHHKP